MTFDDRLAASFLSTAPPERRDRRVAALAMLISLAAFILSVPFADLQGPRSAAFIPASEAALVLVYLISAALLVGQFRQIDSLAVLVLGCGYLFAALMAFSHLLSFPGVFTPAGLLGGGEQTTPWLYILWHALFPVIVGVYGLLAGSPIDRRLSTERTAEHVALGIAGAVALAALCVALATVGAGHLPPVIHQGSYAAVVAAGIGPAALLAITLATLAVHWLRTRCRTVLDLWLLVVLAAWALDIVLTMVVSTDRFDFGWYAGRIYGLVASSFVLAALLIETGGLYARLARALADEKAGAEELARSQEAFRQAQKMEAIGQLTGGVAHDFNNLLTVVIGNLAQIDAKASDTEAVKAMAATAMRAAARGARLTQQLLMFARRHVLRPETANANRLLLEVEGLMRRAVGETIEVAFELDPGLDPTQIDVGQFEAAILNLLVNARDATQAVGGLGRIVLRTRNGMVEDGDAAAPPDAAPGSYAVIAVIDNGVGIAPEVIGKVFEPFFTTKEVGRGSGLGLSQVYGFVKESGGHIRVDSAPGKGTTIELWLPRSSERPIVERPQQRRGRVVPLRPATAGEVVLVVEDDPDVLESAVLSLRDLGYGTLNAHDAPTALTLLKGGERIDILFSDVVMPGGMNGAQLALEARRVRPGLKVLLTSGYAAESLASDLGVAGDVPILTKPYRREDLASKLRVILGGSAS